MFCNRKKTDMGFLSACCEFVLLLLANKEAVLAYGMAECNYVGNPSRKTGVGGGRVREMPEAVYYW